MINKSNNKSTILITRSTKDIPQTKIHFKKMGFKVISYPLLKTKYLNFISSNIHNKKYDKLIITSKYAALSIINYIKKNNKESNASDVHNINIMQKIFKTTPFIVVGNKSAKILRGFGYYNIENIYDNVEDLLLSVNNIYNNKNTIQKNIPTINNTLNILYLRGNFITTDIKLKLQHKSQSKIEQGQNQNQNQNQSQNQGQSQNQIKINVDECQIYETKYVNKLPNKILEMIENLTISYIAFYSKKSVENFINIIAKYKISQNTMSKSIIFNMPNAICISENIANHIKSYSALNNIAWENIIVDSCIFNSGSEFIKIDISKI